MKCMQHNDTLTDYRRVRFEEYVSAAMFSLAALVCGYNVYQRMQSERALPIFVYCTLTIGSGTLASRCFEQGRKLSKEVNRLEKELEDSQL